MRRESRDLGDLTGAVINELRRLDPDSLYLKDLAETNLVIYGSRAEARGHWKALADKRSGDQADPPARHSF